MQSEYRILDEKQGELSVSFTEQEFQAAMQNAYRENARHFDVPGFRKGKAPIGVALRMYGESTLYDDAIQELLDTALPGLVREHEIEAVASPELNVEEIGYRKGFTAKLIYTLPPEVELGEYKGISVYAEKAEISDDALNARLEQVQKENARWIPVEDRSIETGDRVNLDYEGFHNDVAFDGGTATGHNLDIGSNSFIPGFEDALIGLNVGDEKDIELTFPEEYHSEDLAGEDVIFKVKVNSVLEKELPELDDDFAMDVSEFDTFEEYREDIKREMVEHQEEHRQSDLTEQMLQKIVDQAKIDVPEIMIEQEIDREIQQQDMQFRQYGMNFQQFVEMTGQSMDEIRKNLRANAERSIRTGLVLDKIREVEAIEPTQEDMDEELQNFSEQYGMTVDSLKSQFADNEDALYVDLKRRLTMDFLKEHRIELDEAPVDEEVNVEVPEEESEADDSEDVAAE